MILCHLQINDESFTSFFPIQTPFLSLSRLIAEVTSNTMLNRSGESEHLCLVPILTERVFNFSLLSMLVDVGLL